MRFLVEFEEMLYFQWFEGIFGEIVVIFDNVKSGEMLDSSGFCRSWYRTQNVGRGVGTTDMPFLASGCLS